MHCGSICARLWPLGLERRPAFQKQLWFVCGASSTMPRYCPACRSTMKGRGVGYCPNEACRAEQKQRMMGQLNARKRERASLGARSRGPLPQKGRRGAAADDSATADKPAASSSDSCGKTGTPAPEDCRAVVAVPAKDAAVASSSHDPAPESEAQSAARSEEQTSGSAAVIAKPAEDSYDSDCTLALDSSADKGSIDED